MFKQITVVGNVGKDPEIRHLPNGSKAGNFSVAVNESWVDGEGLKQTRVTWFNVVTYQNGDRGLVTSLIEPHLRKGQLVFISGDPTLRQYVDRDGNQRYAFEIKLGPQSTIKMLGGRPGERREGDADDGFDGRHRDPREPNGTAGEPMTAAEKEAAANAAAERRRQQMADEDIPF